MVINKVTLSFIQKSGFIEDIKQNKSVQIFLPPLSGHGDCATDLNAFNLPLAAAVINSVEPSLFLESLSAPSDNNVSMTSMSPPSAAVSSFLQVSFPADRSSRLLAKLLESSALARLSASFKLPVTD